MPVIGPQSQLSVFPQPAFELCGREEPKLPAADNAQLGLHVALERVIEILSTAAASGLE